MDFCEQQRTNSFFSSPSHRSIWIQMSYTSSTHCLKFRSFFTTYDCNRRPFSYLARAFGVFQNNRQSYSAHAHKPLSNPSILNYEPRSAYFWAISWCTLDSYWRRRQCNSTYIDSSSSETRLHKGSSPISWKRCQRFRSRCLTILFRYHYHPKSPCSSSIGALMARHKTWNGNRAIRAWSNNNSSYTKRQTSFCIQRPDSTDLGHPVTIAAWQEKCTANEHFCASPWPNQKK